MAAPVAPAVEYPSSDGQPMAETGIHVQAIMWLHQALQDFFRDKPDTFIASDMLWYWEQGNPDRRVAPDVMVVPGVGGHQRRSFLSWEEKGAIPAIVFEMASRGTVDEDLTTKFFLYEELGVREYVLFDPEGTNMIPRFQSYRLNGTAYRRLRDHELTSELGFGLRAEDTRLRLIDLPTGQPIPTRAEAVEAARQLAEAERQKAEAEKRRADVLQAEVERLRARLQQLGHANGSEG
ncbi:MAG: Uma2 family endonuclease [Gemmataceae bacterium]|nr:Uma2 family endonuclease [Gemmataceae bacterium]